MLTTGALPSVLLWFCFFFFLFFGWQIIAAALRMATWYDEEDYKEERAAGTAALQTGINQAVHSTNTGVAERLLDELAQAIPSQCVLLFLPCCSAAQQHVREAFR